MGTCKWDLLEKAFSTIIWKCHQRPDVGTQPVPENTGWDWLASFLFLPFPSVGNRSTQPLLLGRREVWKPLVLSLNWDKRPLHLLLIENNNNNNKDFSPPLPVLDRGKPQNLIGWTWTVPPPTQSIQGSPAYKFITLPVERWTPLTCSDFSPQHSPIFYYLQTSLLCLNWKVM